MAAAAALVLAGCGNLAPTRAGSAKASPSSHLSLSNFAALVLDATASARSVHAERVETAHGQRTEMTGDTLFLRASYRGRLTLATVPEGTAKVPETKRSELRLVRGRLYMHVPGLVPTKKFLSLDLHGTASPLGGLCACLFTYIEPTETLNNMGRSLTKVDYLGQEKRRGQTLEHYRLEGDTAMIPGAVDATHPRTTRVYQVWLDSRHLMQRMTYSTMDKSVAVTYSHWGERVHVQRPATGQLLRERGTSGTGT